MLLDEAVYYAGLRVTSSILTGVASALLLEIPLSHSLLGLTDTLLICILTIIAAIRVERELQV
jgi:hypothetical protein